MDHKTMEQLARSRGFSDARVIDTAALVFCPAYRKYCVENRCGNYNANYACPPYSGTAEDMAQRVMRYSHALVLRSHHCQIDALAPEVTVPLKARHNKATLELLPQISFARAPLVIASGPCSLCKPCKMQQHQPCPMPEKCFSCLSAYCIDVTQLAAHCGMAISWSTTEASFFSIIAFDPIS